jgi:hypothetical protein
MVGQLIEDHGPNEDLHRQVSAQAETRSTDLDQARTAWLEHAHPAARLNAQFGHACNPGRLAGNLGDIRPIARTQQLKRKEKINVHGWELGR